MKILALETSSKAVSCALWADGVCAAFSYQNSGLTHSRTLMPMISNMLGSAETPLDRVDVIACSRGPGSFTGLRIGVAAAKGMAWARDLPCAGVSTLEAMAAQSAAVPGIVAAVMDARRNQFYNALFDCSGTVHVRLCEDRAVGIDDLKKELIRMGKPVFLVGDGAELCYTMMKDVEISVTLAAEGHRWQTAWGVALCAAAMAQRGELTTAAALTPVYLRLPQAERERLEKLSAGQPGPDAQ